MNRERCKELLPIFKAFANGEDIQYRNSESDWQDDPNFTLSDQYKVLEYRIKPKPREFKIMVMGGGRIRDPIRDALDGYNGEIIKVREIL